jgi:hypothetical protein
MAIHIFCTTCKTSNGLKAKQCSKCGTEFDRHRKYRVTVSHKGQRATRVVENLTIARGAEADLKANLQRGEFNIQDHRTKQKDVTLSEVWEKYLPWARENKTTWRDDLYHYGKHLEPRFGSKALDSITSFEIEKMKLDLKKGVNQHGKPYAPATIKHQIVLLRRLFNVAINWGMCGWKSGRPRSDAQNRQPEDGIFDGGHVIPNHGSARQLAFRG